MTASIPITCFIDDRGAHLPPSNFYRDAGRLPAETVEHFYQAYKTTNALARQAILAAKSPGEAKRVGRRCPLRPDWELVKVDVMRFCLQEKFYAGGPMAEWLLDTGDVLLVEGNWWHDNVWGVCWCTRCGGEQGFRDFVDDAEADLDLNLGIPLRAPNLLGTLLMQRRQLLASLD